MSLNSTTTISYTDGDLIVGYTATRNDTVTIYNSSTFTVTTGWQPNPNGLIIVGTVSTPTFTSAQSTNSFASSGPEESVATSHSHDPKPKDLTKAEGVGIGIGAAIIAGFLAFGACFILMGGRGRRHSSRYRHTHTKGPGFYNMAAQKAPIHSTVAMSLDSAAAVVDSHLPQPVDDKTLADRMSQLKSRIDSHVHNFYLSSGGNEKAAIQALESALGDQSPLPKGGIDILLANSRSRSSTLKTAIAWVIMQRVLPESEVSQSFLPAKVAETYALLSHNNLDEKTQSAFFCQWRAMTAALSRSLFEQETLPSVDDRTPNISAAVEQADTFLVHLAKDSSQNDRLRHLEEITKRAGRLAWLLFSQPSKFTADWSVVGKGLVVFPGLVQVSDENGVALRSPRDVGRLKETVTL